MDTSDRNKKAAARIGAQDLAQTAALAVERAQAARQTFVELNAAQTREVSGGLVQSVTVAKPAVAVIKPPIIYGGIFVPVALAQ